MIFGAVTIFAFFMYWFTNEQTWLKPETVHQALAGADNPAQAHTNTNIDEEGNAKD